MKVIKKAIKSLPPLNEVVKVGDRVVIRRTVLTERGQDSKVVATPIRVTKVNRVTFDGIRENGDTVRIPRFSDVLNWGVDNSSDSLKGFVL